VKIKRLSLLMISLCLILIFTLLSVMGGCAEEAPASTSATTPASTQAPAEPIKLTVVSPHAAVGPTDASLVRWKDELAKRAGDRIEIDFYKGTMGASKEMGTLVENGTIDVAITGHTAVPGTFPIIEVIDLPFEIPSREACLAVIDELINTGLEKGTDRFKILYYTPMMSSGLIMRDKKITKMEDLQGLSLYCMAGPISTRLGELLGATPAYVPGSELYTSLERGVFDGGFLPPDALATYKFYEVCKYYIKIGVSYPVFFIVMNKDTWNKLPADIQKIIDEINQEEIQTHLNTFAELEKQSLEMLESELEVYTLSAEEEARWKQAVAPIAEQWVKDVEAQGLPGQEALDTMRAIVKEYQK
jgi:TRAP-type C4-dicarboxylate transport system substrate-binding protein